MSGKSGRIQKSHNCKGGREDRKRWLDKGDHEPGYSGCSKTDYDRFSDDNTVVVIGDYQPNVEQAESTKEACRGEEWLRILFADKLQGHREEADAKENEVVEVNHQVAGFLGMMIINEVVKLNDIGEEEVDYADEDQDGEDRQVGLGEVVRNPHDGFAKHQDDQSRQSLKEVGENDWPVPGVLTGEAGPNPGDDNPDQGDSDADAIGKETTNQKGNRTKAEDQGEGSGYLAVNLVPGLMMNNQVLETQGQREQAGSGEKGGQVSVKGSCKGI